jgi:hypothetical protein
MRVLELFLSLLLLLCVLLTSSLSVVRIDLPVVAQLRNAGMVLFVSFSSSFRSILLTTIRVLMFACSQSKLPVTSTKIKVCSRRTRVSHRPAHVTRLNLCRARPAPLLLPALVLALVL